MSDGALFFDTIGTPIVRMFVLADRSQLLCLAFDDSKKVAQMFAHYLGEDWVSTEVKTNKITASVVDELQAYFAGELKSFTTPWQAKGTSFQRLAWETLLTIPYGETRPYASQAALMGSPKAFRAVALANAANKLTILLPCHRVIASSGGLSGYGGGVERKRWLLAHEQAYS